MSVAGVLILLVPEGGVLRATVLLRGFIYKDTDTVYLCCFNKGHADVDV